MDRTEILILAHGSRDEAANAEFESLVEVYRHSHSEFEVSHGYIELAAPSFQEALAQAAQRSRRVVVLPLFLFRAGHVKNDIPLALAEARRQFPEVDFCSADSLGAHPAMAELAFERARSHLGEGQRNENPAVVVVGRGASDPDSNADFFKLVRLFSEGRGFSWVLPCFIGITEPRVEETLDLAARARPDRLLVVPYFLFGGQLVERLAGQVEAFGSRYPWIQTSLSSHLGVDSRVFDLMDERIGDVDQGTSLPCDTCQYRTPLPGRALQVGGLRALLWSLRHTFTHNQAVPHVHAHKPFDKHVLICANADCAERGSIALIDSLRRQIKAVGKSRKIRVTRTSCMGRCGEGPTVAVYPDGVWYRGVNESDSEDLLQEHLLNDRLVARLVDQIM